MVFTKAVFHVKQMLQGFCGRKAEVHIVSVDEMHMSVPKQQYSVVWYVNGLVVNVKIHADWTVSSSLDSQILSMTFRASQEFDTNKS